jgi:16S rRNA (uracil1498-N3)-methyltransferase
VSLRSRHLPRVYVPGASGPGSMISLPPDQARHLSRVLRLAAGDALVVFDGAGCEYDALITLARGGAVSARLGEARRVDRESPLTVTLAQAISSGERMDYTVQKAVELGAAAVQPLATERSLVRLADSRAARRVAHWQAVAIAACEQCGRNRVPPVLPIVPLERWLALRDPQACGLMLAPGADISITALTPPLRPLVLLVGPEGGLAPREQEAARAAGFSELRLGPRVLRTETAAVAALAAMQALWGDF